MVELISGRISCWLRRHHLLFRAGELRLQGVGDRFRDVRFDSENIGELAIVNFGPEMCVRHRIDQLHVDAHLIVRLLDTAFENVEDAKLLCDVRQILRRAFEFLRRSPGNDFQVGHLGQPGEDFVLHAFSEKGVVGIATKTVEWQNRDRFGG